MERWRNEKDGAVCSSLQRCLCVPPWPALSSYPLWSLVVPSASGQQTLPCHVRQLWCWSVLMERALSLFVHLKRRHVAAPTWERCCLLFRKTLLIVLQGFDGVCFYICWTCHFNERLWGFHQSGTGNFPFSCKRISRVVTIQKLTKTCTHLVPSGNERTTPPQTMMTS